jgi:quercetin dioxygenase-like cupin family protein
MLSRRRFGACAICAAVAGLVASRADAQSPAPATGGVTRKILSQTDLPDNKYVAIQVTAEIAGGATVARHTHPGVESAYVLEGEGELFVQGQPDRKVKASEGFQIPPAVPHGLRNGDKPMKLAITYVVEKDKPLASPAPG